MPQAVGAFVLAAALILLTAAVRPLGRTVAAVPDGLAAAMLGGILLPFCLTGALAAQSMPGLTLPMVAVFVLVRLWNPAVAVLAALGTGVALAFGTGTALWPALALPGAVPIFIWPEFAPQVLIGLGLPIYVVTMASQNLPGFAVMRAAGFQPPVNRVLAVTGGISGVAALFGAHPINMAAITAAICMDDDVHPNPAQRWKVGLAYAGAWACLGLFSPTTSRCWPICRWK